MSFISTFLSSATSYIGSWFQSSEERREGVLSAIQCKKTTTWAPIERVPGALLRHLASFMPVKDINALVKTSCRFAQRSSFLNLYEQKADSIMQEQLRILWGYGFCLEQKLDFSYSLRLLTPAVRSLTFSEYETIRAENLELIATIFTNLRELKLNSIRLCDETLLSLKNCAKLESLDISWNLAIRGTLFHELPSNIKNLNIAGTEVESNCFAKLKDMALKSCDLTGTRITDTDFEMLPRTITKLTLRSCGNITDDAITKLAPMSLEYLDIRDTQVTGKTFHMLSRTIQEIYLDNCPIEDEAIIHLAEMPLRICFLAQTQITGKFFHTLPRSIEELTLWACRKVDDTAVIQLSKMKLTSINLGKTMVTGTSFGTLAETVREIHLHGCKYLSDSELAKLAAKSLVMCNLAYAHVTDQTIDHLPQTIDTLILDGCSNLSDEGVRKLKNKNLKTCYLGGTGISEKVIQELRQSISIPKWL